MAINKEFTGEPKDMEAQWKKMYLLGGYSALLSFSGTLIDIVVGSLSSGNLNELPRTSIERFAEFQQNWVLGLYHLDLLNVLTTLIMIPVYLALFGLHRKNSLPNAALAAIFFYIGTAIFTAANSALPMLDLSNKYYAAADDTQRLLFSAAGEAMLARGAHGSLGVFIGFMLLTLASLTISLVMLRGGFFSRWVSFFGIIGNSLLLIYILLVTFSPAIQSIAVIIAAPGGIMAMIWLMMTGLTLIRTGKQSS